MNRVKWWAQSSKQRYANLSLASQSQLRELHELQQLLSQGAITVEEYQMKKAENGLKNFPDDFINH
ncbi:SHOCT domain-containing protein [Convivina praedatoris]|uniref:SHOCT domain-containing protein n=1 Tax=Convivina praedatoris TaxID=2880963 RepID=A0ABM9D1E3_9LACO|nr:SHOCT domain-containing protein [Convivina sp. LMG 32447]CAH1851906.1 hypothetical protein R077815_00431 [Convivina sp. LMG 32447]CAH1853968.1 hypothetical protein LMG032447_00763 [Convivina sp. LMG 32447]CAH1854062.1 hypothetical protein R078138_00799 [Convivina sp. LMG 32447]